MGAGLCAPPKHEDNDGSKPPVAYQSQPPVNIVPEAHTGATLPQQPIPTQPPPASNVTTVSDTPVSETIDTVDTSTNATLKDAVVDLEVMDIAAADRAAVEDATAAGTPNSSSKWDDWDEEENTPTSELPLNSQGTTNSLPSSSDFGSNVVESSPLTTTTTAAVGVSLGSDDAVLQGPGALATLPLLCTKCDHDVFVSSGKNWSKNVDYIYVRNFGGVEDKLEDELIVNSDTTAYCCQCSWQNIERGRFKKLSPWGVSASPEGGSGAPGENVFWIVKTDA